MNIFLNDKQIEVIEGETLLETARRTGFEIPSLCYAKGFKHQSSCMVCVVKNQVTGQIIPSCTTFPTEGLKIETDSKEVRTIRKLSLELLLSDHRADCEAPCTMVCPKGLEVEHMLSYYDAERYEEAYQFISEAFSLPEIACDTCKAPCEKACRRGTVDNAVNIREIIKEVLKTHREGDNNCEGDMTGTFGSSLRACEAIQVRRSDLTMTAIDKNAFQSRLGRFTTNEKERLKKSLTTPSRCLHCACAGGNDCKLRLYATSEGIKKSRYEASSVLPAMVKQHVNGKIWFEQAKCIRCGLCVYNSDNGFTFKDRGFGIQVVLPDENRENISESLVEICPTGALYYSVSPVNCETMQLDCFADSQ